MMATLPRHLNTALHRATRFNEYHQGEQMSQQKFEGRITGFFILLAAVIIVLLPLGAIYYNVVKGLALNAPDPRATNGFLRTGASLASDVSLLAYILILVPLMVIGFTYARRQRFGSHKLVMTTVTVLVWIIILYLMAVSYSGAVPFYSKTAPAKLILATIHLFTGLIAQLIATVSVIRMWFEKSLPPILRYEPIKPQMRITLALWLITALLGISIYVTCYGIPLQP